MVVVVTFVATVPITEYGPPLAPARSIEYSVSYAVLSAQEMLIEEAETTAAINEVGAARDGVFVFAVLE